MIVTPDGLRRLAALYGLALENGESDEDIRQRMITVLVPELSEHEKRERVSRVVVFLTSPYEGKQ